MLAALNRQPHHAVYGELSQIVARSAGPLCAVALQSQLIDQALRQREISCPGIHQGIRHFNRANVFRLPLSLARFVQIKEIFNLRCHQHFTHRRTLHSALRLDRVTEWGSSFRTSLYQSAARHTSNSRRSKFHSFRPDTTLRNAVGPGRRYVTSISLIQARSSAVGSSITASLPSEAIWPPTKTTPSYMESARASPASPQMTMRPFCIMKPAM